MDLLAFVIVWPFLILVIGLIFITLFEIGTIGIFGGSYWTMLFLIIVGLLIVLGKAQKTKTMEGKSMTAQLTIMREWVLTFSIALLLPLFIRYLMSSFDNSFGVIIAGLIFGFGLVVWGMFMNTRSVLTYGNIAGGALTLLYVYFQLWQLGDLARVIAAGFGLFVAIVIATMKLKDKLT